MTRSASSLLVLIGLVLLAAIIAAGCAGSVVTPAAGDIKKFSSADEIREYIENNTALAGAEDMYLHRRCGRAGYDSPR